MIVFGSVPKEPFAHYRVVSIARVGLANEPTLVNILRLTINMVAKRLSRE